jgi:cytochrome b involved in lipid metabolism
MKLEKKAGLLEDATPLSWDEIRKHNRNCDCWLVIDGCVYDVTRWVDLHPGGKILCSLAGEDATVFFKSSHLADVTPYLNKFRIGRVAGYQREFDFDNDRFLAVLQRRVEQYLALHVVQYRNTRKLRFQVSFSIASFFASWYAAYFLGSWSATIVMGLISCAMVGGFAHEYCHNTLIRDGNKSNLVSRLASILWAFLFPFMLERHFQYEHFKHHVSPMEKEYDYEVFALRRFLRLSDAVSYKRFFAYQRFYAPLVYAFYITLQVYDGFVGPYFDRREFRKDESAFFQIYAMQLISILVHIALPIYVLGCSQWAGHFLLYNAIWQGTTYYVAATVHMTEPRETNSRIWSYRICHYTANVLCGNRFYDWLSGGFNYQIEHHLLPFIARENLPLVKDIVKSTCREFGYPYREYTSFWAYFRDHSAFLAAKGNPESAPAFTA